MTSAKLDEILGKIIDISFHLLFFATPLIVIPITSELFEFNKIVFVYFLALIIIIAWSIKSINAKKFIFSRTILTIPLLFFLATQFLSTILSIDTRTSFLGYYSRFNGGFLSTLSFTLLFFAFTSLSTYKKAKKYLISLLASSILVCFYAILQHFGIDKDIWVQDVEERVFSTFGQPNWLAAWLGMLIPLAISYPLINRRDNKINPTTIAVSLFITTLCFVSFLFTKSKSGLLGLVFGLTIYLSLMTFFTQSSKKLTKKLLTILVFPLSTIFFLTFIIGTPYTPKLQNLINGNTKPHSKEDTTIPVLERGGTDSGEIRKLVWEGAINIFKKYPITGSGVETFAFSFNMEKPIKHNLTSEWDFIYNKAHNEYLNYLANTGILGTVAYLVFLGFCTFLFLDQILKQKKKKDLTKFTITTSLCSGFASLLVSNFFGFSVVGTSLLLFLFPGFVLVMANNPNEIKNKKDKDVNLIPLTILVLVFIILSYSLGRYWYADYLFNKGKTQMGQQDFPQARLNLYQATQLSKGEANYWNALSESAVGIALIYLQANDMDSAEKFAQSSLLESDMAISLSPKNAQFIRNKASNQIKLSLVDQKYQKMTEETIKKAIEVSPHDPKLYYNLGLNQLRLGKADEAKESFEKSIQLKENYKDPRLALGITFSGEKKYDEAREQFEYILTNIDSKDELTIKEYDKIKTP